MAVVAIALTLSSGAYGYHRDELYFRMLPLKWGYVDQPPLTPLIARMFSAVADQPWALHLPATLMMAGSIVVVTLLTRELGGARSAQALCAWAWGTSLVPLEFSRVLLTATVDLLVWPAIILCVVRAVLRAQPWWWMAAGLVIGLSTYNKWLVALLVLGLGAGILLAGPRHLLRSPWVWGAGLLALLLSAPNLLYQATHGWPQLAMGEALAAHNAVEVRILTVPLLLVMLGLPLVPIWWAGWAGLWRRPHWRPVRFVAVSFPVVVALTLIGGTQPYYPLGLLGALLAAGCVVVADQWWVARAVAVNAATSALIALPVVPVEHLAETPVTTFNQIAQDQAGWPQYVADVARALNSLPPDQREETVVVTENYGEAGAVSRYGEQYGITEVYSAQNELYFLARPPRSATRAVVVGTSPTRLRSWFASCRVVGQLDHALGIRNQEQGQPISLCETPIGGWSAIWPRMRHLD